MDDLDLLFQNNRDWAEKISRETPNFFKDLSQQQAPEILWIGCSDSRVPANEIINLPPGEVFVHRNIANVVVHSDLNCISVIQYAVEVLKIKHIIVCGHYGCGGIKAAMEDKDHGLIDNWLSHIKDVARFHQDKLDTTAPHKKCDVLSELNVIEQVANVCNITSVRHAWKHQAELSVHGWIYDIKDGILKDLKTTVNAQNYKKESKYV